MGFNLDNITTVQTGLKKKAETTSFLKKEITWFKKPFSNKIKEDFYTELSVLLRAGITLKEALELILKSQRKRENRDVLEIIKQQIISGLSLSDSLRLQKPFSDYEYYSVKIGEETGTLAQVSEQLGSFFARKNGQRRNLIGALTYPVIILSTAVLVVVFMLRFVVPMFQDIFRQQGVELPAITKFIISISEFLGKYSWLMLPGVLGLIALKPFLSNQKRVSQLKDSFILKLPFIGNFVRTVYLSQFTQAISLLSASRVPIANSIRLVKQMIRFYPLQYALETVEQHLLRGESLSASMSRHSLFDEKMIALVKVAEETNQTEFMFERLNKQFNTQVQQQSKMLSTLMEPFIILIVGILVGVILIAMYLPMFKLSSVLG